MSIEVTTKDCASLGDAELADMADLAASGIGWEVGELGKQVEEWVLVSQASRTGRLCGYMFTTLERIGGTPAMVIGLATTERSKSSSTVIRALMNEQYHRALMAFPDEDVLVSGCLIDAGGFEAFEKLADVRPADGVRANGEERAWGRRLSKRFGAKSFDDRSMVANGEAERLVLDHQPAGASPESDAVNTLDVAAGDYVIAWGWAMSEFLEKYNRP